MTDADPGEIERLRASEAKYRALFDAMDQGFAEIELITDDEGSVVDWRYVRLNRAFTRLTGMADVTGRLISEILPDLEPAWAQHYTQLLKTGEPMRFEQYAESIGMWLDVYAALGSADGRRALLIYNNITERKRVDAALRKSEARLASAMEVLPVAIGIFGADGRAVLQNKLLRHYLPTGTIPSREPERVPLWQSWDAKGDPLSPDRFPTARALRGEHVVPGIEMLHVPEQGPSVWTEVASVPLIGDDGEPSGAVSVISDIDALKGQAEALRDSEERQAFLLKLSDTLRPLADPHDIQNAAVRLLAEQLQVSRAGYYEVEPDQNVFYITARCERELVPLPDRMVLTDFGEEIREGYLAGRTMVARDTEQDTATDDNRAAVRAIQVRAWIGVPLVKEGRWVAAVGVHHGEPRDWTPAEIRLVEEVGERTWAAVERARAEAVKRETEEQYRILFESIDEGVTTIELIYDDDGKCVDCRYGESNPALERMTGLSDIEGKLVSEVIPDLEPEWLERYDRIVKTGVPERFTSYVQGLGRWLEVYASRLGGPDSRKSVQVYSDVTLRKRADTALRESEARHRLLIGSVAQAIWETDASGVVVTDSPTWRACTGQTLDEWLGYGWLDAIHPDDRAYAERQWREAVAVRGIVNAEFRLHAPDGSWRWTNVRAAPVIDDAGNVEKWSGMNIDIHDRKSVDAALRESEERQTFLLALSDALRPLADPIAIQLEAMRRIGEHLGLSRAQYYEAEPDGAHVVTHGGYADDLPVFVGRLRMEDFGPHVRSGLEEGRTIFVTDAQSDPQLTSDEIAAHEAIGVRAYLGVPLLKDGRFALLLGLHDSRPRQWTSLEIKLAEDVADRTWAAVERARTEAALRGREEQLTLAVDVGAIGHWDFDIATGAFNTSAICRRNFGRPEDEPFSYEELVASIHPDDRERQAVAVDAAISTRGRFEVEYRLITPAGDIRWIAIQGRFVDGDTPRLIGVSQDTTAARTVGHALRASEDRLQILVAELQHRVRNILAIVRSVFARTVETSDDPLEMADHFKGRLDAMARTQVVLTRHPDRTVDLENLIRDELLSVGISDSANVTVEGPDVVLSYKTAESLGLAIHELTTNALKYGALKAAGATLEIRWTANLSEGNARTLYLTWQEQGVPAVEASPSRYGFGRELIEEALPYRLGAETRLEFCGGGVRCSISLALPADEPDAPSQTGGAALPRD